ncbi:MAG: J domain-containing protein [archaeon]|nr:J domain-containing protein [archaeon]
MVKIRGHQVEALSSKTDSTRRALQFKNRIIETLRLVGIRKEDVEIPLDHFARKKAKASVTWYYKNRRMFYSNNSQKTFIENLYLCLRLLEIEVGLVVGKKKTMGDFSLEFEEHGDVEAERKDAREFFGLGHDVQDLSIIDKKYRSLAKKLHPDMPSGSTDNFKRLNHAHKTLRRELE